MKSGSGTRQRFHSLRRRSSLLSENLVKRLGDSHNRWLADGCFRRGLLRTVTNWQARWHLFIRIQRGIHISKWRLGGVGVLHACHLTSQGPYGEIKGPLVCQTTHPSRQLRTSATFMQQMQQLCGAINQFIYCPHMIYWLITSRVMQPTYRRTERSSLNDTAMHYTQTECAS